MFYIVANNGITIKDNNGISIKQDFDPVTRKPFNNVEDMLIWVKNTLASSYMIDELMPMTIDITEDMVNEETQETIEVVKEFGLIGEVTTIKATGNVGLKGKYEVCVLDANHRTVDRLHFNFVDGVGKVDYTFDKAGDYIICFYEIVEIETEEGIKKFIPANPVEEVTINIKG